MNLSEMKKVVGEAFDKTAQDKDGLSEVIKHLKSNLLCVCVCLRGFCMKVLKGFYTRTW